MINSDINDLDELNEEDIKNNIEKYNSTKLADMILSYRYFGIYKELSIISMNELIRRRTNGDNFDYELYIKDNLESLPKINFDFNDLFSLIKNIKK